MDSHSKQQPNAIPTKGAAARTKLAPVCAMALPVYIEGKIVASGL